MRRQYKTTQQEMAYGPETADAFDDHRCDGLLECLKQRAKQVPGRVTTRVIVGPAKLLLDVLHRRVFKDFFVRFCASWREPTPSLFCVKIVPRISMFGTTTRVIIRRSVSGFSKLRRCDGIFEIVVKSRRVLLTIYR